MKILKNVLLLIVGIVLSALLATQFGILYSRFFNMSTGFGSFVASTSSYNFVDGIFPAYLFFLFLLFTAFGRERKYWWMSIGAIPAVIFIVYFDIVHLYFHIALALAGWFLGWAVRKLLAPKIAP